MIIKPVEIAEREVLLDIATQTGLFTPDEVQALLGDILDKLANKELPDGHQAVVCRESTEGQALGWSYFAPEIYSDGVWNIWWFGVAPESHGKGVAQALISHLQETIIQAGGRVIVIETSDQPKLARARRFYEKSGYKECGRIPDFYQRGDAKVIFARSFAKET